MDVNEASKGTSAGTVAIIIIATVIITVIILGALAGLIIWLILKKERDLINGLIQDFINSFNQNLETYCTNLNTTPPTYENVDQLGIEPDPGVYDFDLATALLSVCFVASSYNCNTVLQAPMLIVAPPGFTNIITMQKSSSDPYMGFIFYNDSYAIIVFCGSLVLEQWGIDVQYSQVTNTAIRNISSNAKIHKGFYNAYTTICQSFINNWISSITASDYTVFVTGHSLGGALSTLCIADISAIGFGTIDHYSFASPRVGDTVFASSFDSIINYSKRVNNLSDVIPQLPPPVIGKYVYQHVSGNVPFDVNLGSVGQNHTTAYKDYLPNCPLDIPDCVSGTSG